MNETLNDLDTLDDIEPGEILAEAGVIKRDKPTDDKPKDDELADKAAGDLSDKPVDNKPEDKSDEFNADDLFDDSLLKEKDAGDLSEEDLEKDIPDGMSEAQIDAFKNQRRTIHDLTKQLEGKSESNPELEKEITRLNDQMAQIHLEKSPDFVERYDKPIHQAFQQASKLIQEFGGTANQALAYTQMGLRDRITALSNDFPDVASSLGPLFGRVDSLKTDRNEALSNHATTGMTLEKFQKAKIQKMVDENFDIEVQKAKDGGNVLFNASEGTAWGAEKAVILDSAKQMVLDGRVRNIDIALQASTSDRYRTLFLNTHKELTALKKVIDNDVELSAKIGKTQRDTPSDKKKFDKSKPRSVSQIVDEMDFK